MGKVPIKTLIADRLLLDILGDKWTALVMSNLCNGNGGGARFNEIKRNVKGISQKSLTQCLRRLERNGLVQRTVHTGRVLAVEYSFTDMGRSLSVPMLAIYEWTTRHAETVRRAQARFDRSAG
jgi:DNA-binding HxlR family transcriptional regulator